MHRATIDPLKKWVIKAIIQFSGKTCRDFGTCHMVVLKRPALLKLLALLSLLPLLSKQLPLLTQLNYIVEYLHNAQ